MELKIHMLPSARNSKESCTMCINLHKDKNSKTLHAKNVHNTFERLDPNASLVENSIIDTKSVRTISQ